MSHDNTCSTKKKKKKKSTKKTYTLYFRNLFSVSKGNLFYVYDNTCTTKIHLLRKYMYYNNASTTIQHTFSTKIHVLRKNVEHVFS